MTPELARTALPWLASLTMLAIQAKHTPARPWLLQHARNDIWIKPSGGAA